MSEKHKLLLVRISTVALFGALWGLLIRHLSVHWAVNPQYNFGWFVPVSAAYLFRMHWKTRPPIEPTRSTVATWIFWTAAFAFFPTWLIEQPNPDWCLISWLLTFEIVALSLSAIYFLGGTSWLRHFAFSVCFIFVSVPWLGAVEDSVIQGLTQAATAVTVASLNLCHILALQHGNVIEIKTGLVGVDEACSGVRSLQAGIMLSLFLGELYRASPPRRMVLVLWGALSAFLCNVLRTFVLTVLAAHDGIGAISKWHDPLGFVALGFCLLLIWGMARVVSGSLPRAARSSASVRPIPLPWRYVAGLGAWFFFTVVSVELWYGWYKTKDNLQWSVAWPVLKKDFSNVTIRKTDADTLAFDEGRGAAWANEDGSRWLVFFFKWAQGPTRSRILARMHRPENCLPAAGYKLGEDQGTISVRAKNLLIPFRALNFEHAGNRGYVFYCLWEDRSKQAERPRLRDDGTMSAKLESVLLGERNVGQQVLEIVVFGYPTAEKAENALRSQMEELIRI